MNSGEPLAPIKKFSDFAITDRVLDGEKVKLETILNQEILITGYKLRESKYRKTNSEKCLMMQFEMEGKRKVIFTGSAILIEQMEKYASSRDLVQQLPALFDEEEIKKESGDPALGYDYVTNISRGKLSASTNIIVVGLGSNKI